MSTAVWDTTLLERESRSATRGKAMAAQAHNRDLALAREIARELGASGLVVTADDVRRALAERFPGEDFDNGRRRNWMGSCFAGPGWRAVGFRRSKAEGSHGNLLRAWVLISA